jgi:hypothetical protein
VNGPIQGKAGRKEITHIMSKAKVILAAFTAVLALSAVASSVASAGNWYVNSAKLGAGVKESLATTAAVDASATLNDPEETLKVTCTGGAAKTLDGSLPFIEGTEKGGAESLTFLGCSEVSPAACSVETSIATEPVVATLATTTSPEDRVVFTPKTGTKGLFVNLNVLGSTCAIRGEKPITGSLRIKAPTGQTELTLQPIEGLGSVENNSLLVAGHHAFLEGGRALLRLASGSHWSFR